MPLFKSLPKKTAKYLPAFLSPQSWDEESIGFSESEDLQQAYHPHAGGDSSDVFDRSVQPGFIEALPSDGEESALETSSSSEHDHYHSMMDSQDATQLDGAGRPALHYEAPTGGGKGRQFAFRMAQKETPYAKEFEMRHRLARKTPFRVQDSRTAIPDVMYGVGTDPSHYYPGLTPREVVLSQSIRAFPGTTFDESRVLGMLVNMFSSPRILTNQEILRFLQALRPEPRASFSDDTNQLMQDLDQFVQTLTQIMQEKNADEKIQRFIFHSLYASTFGGAQKGGLVGLDRLRSIWHILLSSQFYDLVGGLTSLLQHLVSPPPPPPSATTAMGQAPFGGPSVMGGMPYQSAQGSLMTDGGGSEGLASQMGFEPHASQRETQVQPEGWDIPTAPATPVAAATAASRSAQGPSGYTAEPYVVPGGQSSTVPPMQHASAVRFAQPPVSSTRQYVTEQSMPQQKIYYQQVPQQQPRQQFYTQSVPAQQQPTYVQAPPMQPSTSIPTQPKIYQQHPAAHMTYGQPQGIGGRDFASMLRQPLPDPFLFNIMEEFRGVLRSLSGSEEYAEVLALIFQTVTELGAVSGYEGRGIQTLKQGIQSPELLLRYEENRRAMLYDLKSIIEAFAGNYSLDAIIAHIDQFQLIFNAEWRWRDLLSQSGSFIVRALRNPNFLESDDFIFKGADLLTRMRHFLGVQHPELINVLLNEVFGLVQAFQTDPLTFQLYQSGRSVFEDLVLNPDTGQPTLKSGFLSDFRNYFLPVVVSSLRFIPLPRLEFSTEQFDMILDNVIISGAQIIPNLVEFRMENELQLSPRPELPDSYFLNIINFAVYQIQANIHNVEYAIRKKTFPRFEDVGLANIILDGNGLSIRTRTAFDTNLPYTTLVPLGLEATIDSLRLQPIESHHPAIYRLFGKSLTNAIKKRICLAIESQIYQAIRQADRVVTRALKGGPGGARRYGGGKGMTVW